MLSSLEGLNTTLKSVTVNGIDGITSAKTKVVVAMSGGVDSSVTAALLQQQGYDVVGVTLQLFVDEKNSCKGATGCNTTKDAVDAATVAAKLNIPHHILDREEVFRKKVINHFVDDYLKGITPLPCARCDRKVKMRELIDFAKSIGASKVATGHYISIVYNDDIKHNEIHRATHSNRDQSHFLYGLSQEDVDFMLCPLGDKNKAEVRRLAADFGLHVDQKKDSQDICFVRDNDYIKVIQKVKPNTELNQGNIVLQKNNKVLGQHNGLLRYTIGQRKGIGVPYHSPLYVSSLDFATNTLYVGEEESLYSDSFIIEEVNLLATNKQLGNSFNCKACVRALQPTVDASITLLPNNTAHVQLHTPARAVTAGQVCSFYEEDKLFGGGIIKCVEIS